MLLVSKDFKFEFDFLEEREDRSQNFATGTDRQAIRIKTEENFEPVEAASPFKEELAIFFAQIC